MQVEFDTTVRDMPVRVEATVTLTSRGASYSDAHGDFGPERFDAQATEMWVFDESGREIFDSLEFTEKVQLTNECEAEALK